MNPGFGKILNNGCGFTDVGLKRETTIFEFKKFFSIVVLLGIAAYFGLQTPDKTDFVEADLTLKTVDFSEFEEGFRHMKVNAETMIQNDREKINKSLVVDAIFYSKEEPDFRSFLKSATAVKKGPEPIVFTGNVLVENTKEDKLFTEELIYGGDSQKFQSNVPVRIEKPGMFILADQLETQPKLQNGRLSGYVRIEIFDTERVKGPGADLPDLPATFPLSLPSWEEGQNPGTEAASSTTLPPKELSYVFKQVFKLDPNPKFFQSYRPKKTVAKDPLPGFFSPLPFKFSTKWGRAEN